MYVLQYICKVTLFLLLCIFTNTWRASKAIAMPRSNPAQTFEAFFASWLVRQESFLDELCNTIHHNPKESEAEMNELLTRVSAHYQEYYTAKSRLAQHDIIHIFSPKWFTPFEKTFLWIGGFKPGLAFHLVKTFIHDLNNSQRTEIEKARTETKLEERELMEELTRIQETIAAPLTMEMVRRGGETTAVEELENAMEAVMECADFLRMKTVMRIMEILGCYQNVVFFSVVARLQLQVRRWGLELQAAAGEDSSSAR